MQILSDINLDQILFSSNGRDLTFNFVNMIDGARNCVIKCKSIYMFSYNNTFEDEDGFACYVGEVTCTRIRYANLKEWLKEKKFGFSNIDKTTYIPTKHDLFNLHIEGGEVVINVLCEQIEKDENIVNTE